MPVPVIGIVAKWTMKTANPMGRGASTFFYFYLFIYLQFQSEVSK